MKGERRRSDGNGGEEVVEAKRASEGAEAA